MLQTPLLLHGDYIDYPTFASAGLWQAAAWLRERGHDVFIHDALCQPTSGLHREAEGFVRLGVPVDAWLKRLPEGDAPDVAVIANSPWLRARPAARELARVATALATRWPDTPLVLADCDVGGMHTIAWDEADLDEVGIEYGQRFEAEGALDVLVETLADGQTPGARIVDGHPTAHDLDALPLPAYDLVDIGAFQRFMGRVAAARHKAEIFDCTPPLLAIKTSRGCVYKCNFCTSSPWLREDGEDRGEPAAKTYRRYSEATLERHLGMLKDRYGVNRVVILDELVNVHAGHFDMVLDVLERLQMRVDFPNGMRADRLTEDHIVRLQRLCPVLSISAEAATERVANGIIGKRFDLEATERVARWCREHGLRLVVHWMIGQPGETRAEIGQTLETAWTLFDRFGAHPLVQFATPIKGTALYAEVERKGLWVRREDRDIGPLFQGEPVFQDMDWTARELFVAKQVMETRVRAHNPKKIIMNTTYICNNQCVFCATGNRLPTHGDVEEQVRWMVESRKKGYYLIDFDGGEPTTNPNLFKLLKTAKKLGYEQINLTTNGRMMMLPKNAEKIVRSGITNLLVSLHGPNADVHEQQVQSKNAFAQTTAGIRNARPLAERHGVGFGVNVTLTKTNFPVLMEYGALLDDMGVRHCNIQFVTPFGKASAETQPDPATVAPSVMRLIDAYGDRITFKILNLPVCYMPGYEEYALGDIYKLERHMVFVSMQDVNLFDYLQSRRRYEAACDGCLFRHACEGRYYFPDEWQDDARALYGD